MPRGLRRGCLRPGGLSVGIGWDNPELTELCRYDARVVVPDGTALDPADPSDQGIGLQTVEGGLYACYRRMVGRAQFSEALNEQTVDVSLDELQAAKPNPEFWDAEAPAGETSKP